jgi:hypothetical protein
MEHLAPTLLLLTHLRGVGGRLFYFINSSFEINKTTAPE